MSGFRNARELGRPVTIKDEGISLHTNVAAIDFEGAGVTGAVSGDEVTETIPGGGGSYTPETPVGAINGSNKVFTISSANLQALYLNGVWQEPTGVYSLSGTTITYVTAPRRGMSHKAVIFT